MHVERFKKTQIHIIRKLLHFIKLQRSAAETPVTNKNAIFSSKNCFKLESYVELTPYTTNKF